MRRPAGSRTSRLSGRQRRASNRLSRPPRRRYTGLARRPETARKRRSMDAGDPDLMLLERWRRGERRAGEDLFARHFADIYWFFEHKTAGEADELAQQTFMACVAGRDAFRGQSTFRTYLFAIARNQLYSYLRRAPQRAQADFAITSLAEIVTSLSSRI